MRLSIRTLLPALGIRAMRLDLYRGCSVFRALEEWRARWRKARLIFETVERWPSFQLAFVKIATHNRPTISVDTHQ